jgi:hypothetical protein
MPLTITANFSQQVTIPENAASINIKLYGGGGGGEFVNQNTLVSTAGTSGGTTSFIGLNATGGQGGGIGGKNQGGAGGSGSQTVNWSSLGASVNIANGSSGGLNLGGTGGTTPGINAVNGGAGTPQGVNYTSNVFHVFDNDTNVHQVTSSSPDIIVGYESPNAANDLPCTLNTAYKHYLITFIAPYDDASYSFTLNSFCDQTAGGATGGVSFNGRADITRFGFRIWFCRNANSYVRCFTFTTSGNRSVLLGRGGGGAGFLETNITRTQLIESSTYRPGTTHQLTIGTAGSRGGASAINGGAGKAFLTIVLEPRIVATIDSATIIRGQCTTLRWDVTGDVGSVSISPVIGAVNINGNREVCPTETITYTITASGLGGVTTADVTLVVYQPPTVNLTGPASINYGQQGTLSYTATNIDISLIVTPIYSYRGSSVTGAVINLPIGTTVSGSIATQIPYNDFGPTSVTYVIVATGNGGQESKQLIIPINIDETPANFLIPESEDLLKSQEPIVTPDAVVTSYEITVDDIDIPVEIKADRPILVDINNTDTWIPIREI